MTKKIAVINDLSGFGRCSLTAAISVISAMGIQACPLPTAILTAQTGYPHYYLDDYTDKMDIYRQEWQKMGQHFDGIYTGFVASEAQIDQIFHFIETFHTQDTFLLVDPVMGDDGIKYDMFTPKLLEKMKALAEAADIITPNLTELCLLTDASYDTIMEITDKDILIDVIGELAGDLFASCIAAGKCRGDKIPDLIHLAGTFLEQAIKDSAEENVPYPDGTNYEKYLHLLMMK